MIIDSAPARIVSLPNWALAEYSATGTLLNAAGKLPAFKISTRKLHLLLGEMAGDLPVILNAALNIGGRLDRIVQNNSQLIFQPAAFVGHVAAGQIAEQLGPAELNVKSTQFPPN